jgi:hypothetical protein
MNATIHNPCPCCGRPWDIDGEKAEAWRVLFPLVDNLGGQRSLLLKFLLDHFGEWSPRIKLAHALYAHIPHGGPDNANNSVSVQLTRLRNSLSKYGYAIEWRSNKGSRLKRIKT